MCPVCMITAAWVATGAASTGGVIPLVLKHFWRKNSGLRGLSGGSNSSGLRDQLSIDQRRITLGQGRSANLFTRGDGNERS